MKIAIGLESTTGGKVPKRQAEELAARMAHDFDAFYEERMSKEREKHKSLLVMSLDSKGIVMCRDELREATRKAAENGQDKKRLGAGQKRNRKRMATVASVYSVDEYHRNAEQVMGVERADPKNPRPKPRNKRVWASVEKEAISVTREAFEEAKRRDPENERRWIMLVDTRSKGQKDANGAMMWN